MAGAARMAECRIAKRAESGRRWVGGEVGEEASRGGQEKHEVLT